MKSNLAVVGYSHRHKGVAVMSRTVLINLPDQANEALYGLTAGEFQRMLNHAQAEPERLVLLALARLSEEFGTRIEKEAANDELPMALAAKPEETQSAAASLLGLLSHGEDDATTRTSPAG